MDDTEGSRALDGGVGGESCTIPLLGLVRLTDGAKHHRWSHFIIAVSFFFSPYLKPDMLIL